MVTLWASVFAGTAFAQQADSPRKHHPWASFSPGAWKIVRTTTETFDADGKVASTGVTETKTTLKRVDDDAVTLEVEVGVWVGGRLLDPKPQTVRQGLHGEAGCEKATVKDLGAGEVVVEDRAIACRTQQVEVTAPDNKWTRTIKVFHSNDVAPYMLKCESITKEVGKEAEVSRMTMVVDALQMPCEIAEHLTSVAHSRTVLRDDHGVTTTLAYTSTEVPGGMVRQWSKEEDKAGHLVRRTVMEMTDFGIEPEVERPGLFHRRVRPGRARIGAWDTTE
jgi:hypothetical protein